MPIDAIKEKHNGCWDDGDILRRGEYTAIALDKKSTFLQREKLTKTTELLTERLRYGVNQGIVKAGLTRLPLIVRNKARFLPGHCEIMAYTVDATEQGEALAPGEVVNIGETRGDGH